MVEVSDRAKELVEYLKTPEGKEEFERLRARRFSHLVKPLLPEGVDDPGVSEGG